eukprot:14738020-Alexandrium_andersonii.AAC.1
MSRARRAALVGNVATSARAEALGPLAACLMPRPINIGIDSATVIKHFRVLKARRQNEPLQEGS